MNITSCGLQHPDSIRLQKVFCILLLLNSAPVHSQSPVESMAALLQTTRCPSCNLIGVDLTGRNLVGADLQAADLTGANLTGADLRGANLSGSILKAAIFADTRLAGANLRNADLSDLDIDAAFEWMEIIGAQLQGARFKDGVTCGPSPEKGGWGCQHAWP